MTDRQPDLWLDSTLVYASMRGMFEVTAWRLGLTPDEAFGRAEWLRQQPERYIKQVCDKVAELESADKKVRV